MFTITSIIFLISSILFSTSAFAVRQDCKAFAGNFPVNCYSDVNPPPGGSGNIGIGTTTHFAGYVGVSTAGPFQTVEVAGNVGIGTLVPGTKLDVTGTSRMTGFQLTGNGVSSGNVMVTNSVGLGTWMAASTLPITPSQWTTANTNDVYLPNNGNVGLGTTLTSTAALNIMNGNVGIGTWKPTDLLTVSNGNVGIGKISTGKLTLYDGTATLTSADLDNNNNLSAVCDSNLYLLLHLDADYTDSNCATAANTVTNHSMTIDNVNYVFGGGSATSAGTGYLTVPSTNLSFGSGDFTIEVRLYYLSTATTKVLQDVIFFENFKDGSNFNQFYVNMNSTNSNIYFITKTSGTTNGEYTFPIPGNGPLATQTFYDIVWQRTGTNFGVALNGNWITATVGTAISSNSLFNDATAYGITDRNNGASGSHLRGNIDELSVSKTSRYTIGVNFTPKTIPFGTVNGNSTAVRYYDNGTPKWSVGNDGVHSDTYSISSGLDVTTSSKLAVSTAGNVGVGTNTPQGGLVVMNGNIGIGTWKPANSFDIKGNAVIGATYAGVVANAAPANGLLVQGNTGIGTINPGAALDVTGGVRLSTTLVGIGTLSVGASIVAAGNQACNTTCTTGACLMGEDTSVLGSFVDCADATADRCVCLSGNTGL